MNGLEKILSSIEEEADNSVREIREKTDERIGEIRDTAEKQAAETAEKIRRETDRTVSSIRSQNESSKTLLKQRLLLEKKQELIHQTMEETLQKAADLPEEEYFTMLSSMLSQSVHEGESGVIRLNGRDLERVRNASEGSKADDFRKTLEEKQLSLSEDPVDAKGGFLLSYPGIDENCTLEEIMSARETDFVDTIRGILFRED